jgi:probable blue pigment (indigoidine) exporter
MLLVAAVAVEGAPPPLDGRQLAGFAFVSLLATAVAFVCWFAGLAHLPAGTVGTVGLLNPVTGVLLGTLAAGERLTPAQGAGILLVLVGIGAGSRARPTVAPPPAAAPGTGRQARDRPSATA